MLAKTQEDVERLRQGIPLVEKRPCRARSPPSKPGLLCRLPLGHAGGHEASPKWAGVITWSGDLSSAINPRTPPGGRPAPRTRRPKATRMDQTLFD